MSRTQRKFYNLIAFEGGMQSFSAPHYRRDNQSKLLLNWSPRIPGELEMQRGGTIVGTGGLTGDPKGIGVFEKEDGSNSVIRLHDTDVDYYNGSAWINANSAMSSNNSDIAELVNTYTDDEERIYIATGFNDTIKFWDGTNFDAIADTYAKHIELFQNRIYLGNVKLTSTTYPVRLIWSDVGTDVFNTTVNRIDDVGEPITALKTFSSRLFIFSINKLFSYDGYALRDIPGEYGTTSSRTVNISDGKMYWYNRQGVFSYDGVSLPRLISRPIQDWIDSVPSATGTSAWIDKYGRYVLQLGNADITINGVEYSNPVAIYDPYLECWSTGDKVPIHSAVRVRSGGIFANYGIRYNTNDVFLLDNDFDDLDGVDIEAIFESRELGAESPHNLKNFYNAFVTYVPQNNAEVLEFESKRDGGAWEAWESISLAGTEEIKTAVLRFPTQVKCKILEIRVKHTASSNAVIQQIRVEYDEIKFM